MVYVRATTAVRATAKKYAAESWTPIRRHRMTDRPKVLSVCDGCKWAEWKKTSNGRRHPDGSGQCAFRFPDIKLPKWVRDPTYGRDPAAKTLDGFMVYHAGVRYIYRVDRQPVAEPCQAREEA